MNAITKESSAHWVAPALVAVALLSWGLSVAVFLTHPLSELPRYFMHRYLVLDATSMLFVLLINTVFLGISVYMLSRERTSPCWRTTSGRARR
jgi:hydrogenase-4 component F